MFNYIVNRIKGRKCRIKDSKKVYRRVINVTSPSKPYEIVELCDWNPKYILLGIDGNVVDKFSTESGNYEIKRLEGLPGFHVWNKGDKLYLSVTNDIITSVFATIVILYKKDS